MVQDWNKKKGSKKKSKKNKTDVFFQTPKKIHESFREWCMAHWVTISDAFAALMTACVDGTIPWESMQEWTDKFKEEETKEKA